MESTFPRLNKQLSLSKPDGFSCQNGSERDVDSTSHVGSQDVERRNTELEGQIQSAEKTLASSQEEQEQAEVEVRRVIEVLDVKICDLSDLRQSLAKLVAD